MDGGTSKMQTGNNRYHGGGIKPPRPDLAPADLQGDGLRRNVVDRLHASAQDYRNDQEHIYNRAEGFAADDRFLRGQQQSHAQQVHQVAARVGVANQNRFADTVVKKTTKNLSYSKNIFKGVAFIIWRPFGALSTVIKRQYTHLSLKFEQANLLNTSLRSLINSALIVIFIISAVMLYRNGYVANIKHNVIAKIGQWSGAAGVNIQEVKLFNRHHTSKQEILNALNVKIGTPLLSFDVDAAKERIEQIGWVAQAEVQRILPDRLEISIVEREPFAIWQINGKHHLVDRDGALVADKILRGYHLLPLIVGKGAATEALSLLSELEERPEIFEHVRALVRVSERRWDMDLQNGMRVLLPAEKPEAMLADLERMILGQDILSRGIKLIDFRLKDRVRFEMDDVTAKAYFEAKQIVETPQNKSEE